MRQDRKIAVIGLGYVGLPVAYSFDRIGYDVVGFDINHNRVDELAKNYDRTGELTKSDLEGYRGTFTDDSEQLRNSDFYIVTVPTPIDNARRPDMRFLKSASELLSPVLKKGDIVVYESTVYPGATRDICVPLLEAQSGLVCGKDFSVGYSPERINPGDKEHTFEKIVKVVSGWDEETLRIVSDVYASAVTAGVHEAQSIETAEAAKVIENTQRDLNIAFVNELSLIFSTVGLDTNDVLDAAMTKWNFLPFRPGLVGGHCIGVDPYYLTEMAQIKGAYPELILAGRRVNGSMGDNLARTCLQLIMQEAPNHRPTVTVLGFTFKENVPDIRNTRAVDIVTTLQKNGVNVQIIDPWANQEEMTEEYDLKLTPPEEAKPADSVILAVPHREFMEGSWPLVEKYLAKNSGIFLDLKAAFDRNTKPDAIKLWRP